MPVIKASNVADYLLAYTNGELDEDDTLALFSYWVKTDTLPARLRYELSRLIFLEKLTPNGEIVYTCD